MNASSVAASPVEKLSTLLGSLVVASAMVATHAHAATQTVTLGNFMYAPAALTVAAGDSYCDVHGAPTAAAWPQPVTVTGAAGAMTPLPRGAPILSGRVSGGMSLRLVLKSSEAATFRAVVQQRSKSTGWLRRIGTIRLTLQAGTNRLRARTVAGTKLTAGRYRLVGRAIDSDGQKSASLTRAFTIGS